MPAPDPVTSQGQSIKKLFKKEARAVLLPKKRKGKSVNVYYEFG